MKKRDDIRYVCVRDDDTNYFTTVEDLRSSYEDLWGEIPITLAVIPFAHGSDKKILDFDLDDNKFKKLRDWEKSASAGELTEYHKVYPVGGNCDLVVELKDRIKEGSVEIAQHGVFHRYNERGGEMRGDEMAYEAVRDGKEYLEKVFKTKVRIFIPPSNTIDEVCYEYIKKLDMYLFTGYGIRYTNKRKMIASYLKDPKSLSDKFKTTISHKTFPVRRRCGGYIFGSTTFNSFGGAEASKNAVLKQLSETGFAAVATHYRALIQYPEYRKKFLEFLKQLNRNETIQFVMASKYYELMVGKYYE